MSPLQVITVKLPGQSVAPFPVQLCLNYV
jgi:hypothetical protein